MHSEYDYRNFVSTKYEIKSVAELANIKVHTAASPVEVASKLGLNSIPIAWAKFTQHFSRIPLVEKMTASLLNDAKHAKVLKYAMDSASFSVFRHFNDTMERTFFRSSAAIWTEGLARFIFIWISYFVIPLAIKSRNNFRLDIVTDRLPARIQRISWIIVDVFFLILVGVVFYMGLNQLEIRR